jgi:hypothetical protein
MTRALKYGKFVTAGAAAALAIIGTGAFVIGLTIPAGIELSAAALGAIGGGMAVARAIV